MNERLNTVLVFIVLAVVKFSNAANYCAIQSCQGLQHTACIYSSSKPSNQCTGYQGSGLTQQQKQSILNLHNQLRQMVASGKERRGSSGPQPAAKYMPNLQWDEELELIAQRWTDQCTWSHDQCRDVERFKVGQNIAYIDTAGDVKSINILTMVNNWYNEVKVFNRNEVSRFRNGNGSMIGHYTQMVWAKTTKLGCGAVKYKDGSFNKLYLVCNYGPAGNFINQAVYETR